MKTISIGIFFVLLSGCASTSTPIKGQQCCQQVEVRTKEMSEFNRYCMMLVFAGREESHPEVLEDIKQRLELCKFVFSVSDEQSLISTPGTTRKPYQTIQWKKAKSQQIFRDFNSID